MKIRFSDFVLDEERVVLERDGARVALRPKVFDLLVQLVRQRARVVRREELTHLLWKGMSVGPGSLSGLVNELRQALGEHGQGPSSIRTVHARGYQFVAQVEEFERADVTLAAPFPLEGERKGGHALSERVTRLIESVAAEGTRGIVLSSLSTSAESGDRASGVVSGLEPVLSGAELAGFELEPLSIPDRSMASTGRLARDKVDALVASRGWEAVRAGMPLPARVWLEEQSADRVAGGFARPGRMMPGGLGSVASLLSALGRRRPLVWVFEEVDRGGLEVVRNLATLARRLEDDPVLWVATLGASPEAGALQQALEEEAGFLSWSTPQAWPDELNEQLRRRGHPPLPRTLGEALLSHVRGDREALAQILGWIDRESAGAPSRARPGVLRVEPQGARRGRPATGG